MSDPGGVWEFYGSTEAQFTVCGPDEWLAHPGTVGRARPGRRLSIVATGAHGNEAGDGRDDAAKGAGGANGAPGEDGDGDGDGDGAGTIWCDMPSFARFTYWGDEQATGRAWRGTACSVGDLGRLDDEGYLYLSGRRHDLIISGGVNVYPAEVEAVLSAVPGVLQLAVFGMPDEQWGQKVCVAFVADRAGAEEAMREAASYHLAPYKRPKAYFATAELPHTATGKLLRRAVPSIWAWRRRRGRTGVGAGRGPGWGLVRGRADRVRIGPRKVGCAIRIRPCPTPRSIPPPARPRRRSRCTPRPRWRRSCSGRRTPSPSTAPRATPSGPAT